MIANQDKAPEGATHRFSEPTTNPWRDLSGPTWKWWSEEGVWVDSKSSTSDLIKRQLHRLTAVVLPAWTGEGQPPAGAECEIIEGDRVNWEEGRKHLIGERVIVHASFINGCDQLMTAFEIPRTNKCYVILSRLLRPARTPEQIAAEEREKAVAAMLELDPYLPNTTLWMMSRADFCRALYDANYRKQVAP